MTLDMVIKSRETIKGKICTLKNIEEFSIFTQENEDRRDYSLKYKLILTILVFLFELSNQYFYHSAKYVNCKDPCIDKLLQAPTTADQEQYWRLPSTPTHHPPPPTSTLISCFLAPRGQNLNLRSFLPIVDY